MIEAGVGALGDVVATTPAAEGYTGAEIGIEELTDGELSGRSEHFAETAPPPTEYDSPRPPWTNQGLISDDSF